MSSSRQELVDYALRALGAPTLSINVDDDQLEDRVDEALAKWYEYHFDGMHKVYLKQQITASELRLTTSTAANFAIGSIITGGTSGATAQVCKETNRESSGITLLIRNVSGTFTAGETITSDDSNTAVLATNPLTLGNYDKRYIDIPDYIWGVSRVLPFSNASSSKNIFDLQYQLRLNDLYDLTSTSLIYYKTVMNHLALLDFELNGKPMFRYNRMMNKLFLDVNWESDIALGDFIILDCYRATDPKDYSKVWNESWLKHYTTALFKKQWGTNLKKFNGIQLAGGVALDGQSMYDEAVKELEDLEEQLVLNAGPLDFFLG